MRRPWSAGRLLLLALLLWPAAALGQERALDPQVFEIGRLLRCPTCVSESVAESSSPIAREMRVLIQEQLDAGADRAQVLAFFQERYGDWILQEPPFSGLTLALWLAPALALLIGAVLVWRLVARWRRGSQEPAAALAPEDEARLAAAMAAEGGDPAPRRTES